MATNLYAAKQQAAQIALDCRDRLLLAGYTALAKMDSDRWPVVAIRLDEDYLDRNNTKNVTYYTYREDYLPKGYTPVLEFQSTSARAFVRTGRGKINYVKDGGFPVEVLIQVGLQKAARETKAAQDWREQRITTQTSLQLAVKLAQDFPRREDSLVELRPSKERPEAVECHLALWSWNRCTAGNLAKLLLAMPPDTPVSFSETVVLTEPEARTLLAAAHALEAVAPDMSGDVE